jgi:large subunit ribosomal protein L25
VRREGKVPGVIYGDSKPPVTISLDSKELTQRILAGRFLTTLYDLEVDGAKHRVIPRDFQLDPVKDFPVHVVQSGRHSHSPFRQISSRGPLATSSA